MNSSNSLQTIPSGRWRLSPVLACLQRKDQPLLKRLAKNRRRHRMMMMKAMLSRFVTIRWVIPGMVVGTRRYSECPSISYRS